MIRKLISLPEDLDKLIQRAAMQERKPQAAIIREKLRAGFAVQDPKTRRENTLLKLAAIAVPGLPSDLSTHIDEYLYNE